jgi:hypothetical protein
LTQTPLLRQGLPAVPNRGNSLVIGGRWNSSPFLVSCGHVSAVTPTGASQLLDSGFDYVACFWPMEMVVCWVQI